MSASPLVTVLLPVWNGASLPLTAEGEEPLRVAIRSLARQEAAPDAPVPGFEVLAVDDGSTDGTAALLDALAAEYPCLRVLHRPARRAQRRSGGRPGRAHRPHGRR